MTIKDGDCKSCEHFVKDAYGQFVCEFDGECENMVREMTNEEWFCSLSTEEKAKWLSRNSKFMYGCGRMETTPKVMYEEDWEWWLKQPHREVDKQNEQTEVMQ